MRPRIRTGVAAERPSGVRDRGRTGAALDAAGADIVIYRWASPKQAWAVAVALLTDSRSGALTMAIAVAALLALAALGCGGNDGEENGTSAPETRAVRCTEPPRELLDPATIVGERLADASATAEQHGCSVREVIRDGKDLAVTADYVPDRINVETEDGTVVEIADIG